MVDFITADDAKLHYILDKDTEDNVDIFYKYGSKT
tara:strand:+ start:971 stop:1075 length:105 start_codon:yes stop_codon:yes gene_type:complete